ncbi:MAG: tetratricopeptide repeat protein [Bacteroidia bacterium]|nr:tetratricopeptide repeat protein [Bacteroidia bacterium]
MKIYLLLLFIFTFLLYGNTIKHDYVLDDDIVTRGNKFVQQGVEGISSLIKKGYYYGFNGDNEGAYRPLVSVNFAIEYELFGNNPQMSHFFNVLFYAISCVLLFILLGKLFRESSPPGKLGNRERPDRVALIPLLITILFIAHPIHTEVVANIKSRDEILHFLFAVLTINFLMDYHLKNKSKFLVLSLISYFLCLLTKEIGLTLVAIIPLTLYFFTGENLKRIFFITARFAGIVVIYMLIRSVILDDIAFSEKMDVINNSLMAAESASEMLATSFVILGKYLGLLIFPHPLSWDYSYNQVPITNWSNIGSIASLLIYVALGIFALWGLKKRWIQRVGSPLPIGKGSGDGLDALAFGVLFFFITLSLVSNLFIKIGSTMGERFLYAPSLGFCIAMVMLLIKMLKIDPTMKTSKNRMKLIGIVLLVGFLYSFKTYKRNADWKNNFTLFSADVSSCPNGSRTHYALASEYRTKGEIERNAVKRNTFLKTAIGEYKKSVEIYPEFTAAWYNLGVAYYANGENENALGAYNKAIQFTPSHKQSLNNVGVIYFNKKDYDNALKHFLKAVESNPNYGDPYANIGAVYHNKGEYDKAITYYEKALKYNPNNINVNNNLSKLYNSLGDQDKANYYSKKTGKN